MSFAEVQSALTDQFKGANAEYLTTYAGKMELLGTAAGEAKETIGKGLVDALSLLSGSGNTVQPLADSMADFSLYVSDAIVGVAVLIDKLNKVPGMGKQNAVTKNSFLINPSLTSLAVLKKALDYVSKTGAEFQAMTNPITMGYLGSMPVGIYPTPAELAKQQQMEKDRLKLERERANLQKKATIDAKKKAALDKAARTLDLERINLTAALNNQISETDRLSLNLQLALLDKNDSAATKLSGELTEAVKRQNALNAALLATPEAPNPYRNWKVPDMGSMTMQLTDTGRGGGGFIPDFNVPANSFSQVGPMGGLGAGVIAGVNPQINITVELDGKTVTGAITESQVNQSLSGTFSDVSRYNGRGAPSIK